MKFRILFATAVLAVLVSCGRPSAGDFTMPVMGELAVSVNDGSVGLRCALSSTDGISEAGAYLSDGTVETRNKGKIEDGSIVVTVDGLKSGKEYSYCFFISNGTYEKISESSTFRTDGMTDYVEFDDEEFKNFCISNFDSDGDGRLSGIEAASVKAIKCEGRSIKSLKGIECFTALKDLNCGHNSLRTLDLTHNKALAYLDCNSNKLSSLQTGSINVVTIYCYNNLLLELDVSKNTNLRLLNAGDNVLSSLDISSLDYLEIINVENNTGLTTLTPKHPEIVKEYSIGCTGIRRWDFTDMVMLENFSANGNVMPCLPAFYSDEKITNLHLSGDVMKKYMTAPDYFKKYPNLIDLNCSCHRMANADFTGNAKLENIWIECADNLVTIDLSNSPNLRKVVINEDLKLETVYVHPDVNIDALTVESDNCHAEFKHKQ